MNRGNTVYVGLSGGVDSSVAALRLQQRGFNVVGVFIKTWHPDFLPCTWKQEREDAMRVAATLGIPFVTYDAEAVYRDSVAHYMISEYQAGRTPNPDVMCNKFVKFGAFFNFAKTHGALVATGHYARVTHDQDGWHLRRGVDSSKDQTYFLWTLQADDLPYIHFPIGDTYKADVRHEARSMSIFTSEKPDSQGICFLGAIDLQDFLSRFITLIPGDVYDESGSMVGTHHGVSLYTIGQRHGLKISTQYPTAEPYYVVSRDMARNVLVVSHVKPVLTAHTVVEVGEFNHIRPLIPEKCTAQFRYRQTPFSVSVHATSQNTYQIRTSQHTIDVPSVGQSCVLYQDDECLGGGIITAIYENN